MTHSRQIVQIEKWDIYWRWKILSEVPKTKRTLIKNRQFKCKCECWTLRDVSLKILRSWESKSCGCLKKELIWDRSKTNCMSSSKIYKVYFWIKDRCNNENNKSYHNYGKRWIKLLWNTFEDFYKDMWPTYKQWLTIDREDNDWHYCKDNCRWTDRLTQANNTRHNHNITHNWETNSIAEWARILNKNVSTLRVRIHRWKSIFN